MTVDCLVDCELKKYTTFKIGGCARRLFLPKTIDELVEVLKDSDSCIILGGCSNVLIASGGIESDVILTKELNNFKFQDTDVIADCGVMVPILSRAAQKNGLSGFEFMACFPGSVGGVVYMNASAHNQFVSDTFVECRVFDLDSKQILRLAKKDMCFAYRDSVLSRKNYILLDARFKLIQKQPEVISELMKKNIDARKEKQPGLSVPNAGSIFKNPPNDSAGRLLEAAGVKGMSVGGARVWDRHCNFIVNYQNADSYDVLALMNKMYKLVKEKFNVTLEPEVRFLGKASEEESKLWNMMLKKL